MQKLELRPSRWQLEAMTVMPLAICGAFTATAWFIMGGVWGKVLAFGLAAFGIWCARAGRRLMKNSRLRADNRGIFLFEGSHNGEAHKQTLWENVALCTIENRSSGGGDASVPHIILKDAGGGDLFALYTKYLSRADTRQLLNFVRAELERRDGARFDVPADWR